MKFLLLLLLLDKQQCSAVKKEKEVFFQTINPHFDIPTPKNILVQYYEPGFSGQYTDSMDMDQDSKYPTAIVK